MSEIYDAAKLVSQHKNLAALATELLKERRKYSCRIWHIYKELGEALNLIESGKTSEGHAKLVLMEVLIDGYVNESKKEEDCNEPGTPET